MPKSIDTNHRVGLDGCPSLEGFAGIIFAGQFLLCFLSCHNTHMRIPMHSVDIVK